MNVFTVIWFLLVFAAIITTSNKITIVRTMITITIKIIILYQSCETNTNYNRISDMLNPLRPALWSYGTNLMKFTILGCFKLKLRENKG